MCSGGIMFLQGIILPMTESNQLRLTRHKRFALQTGKFLLRKNFFYASRQPLIKHTIELRSINKIFSILLTLHHISQLHRVIAQLNLSVAITSHYRSITPVVRIKVAFASRHNSITPIG